MKIIKINENLKINIESIYSLEKISNENEVNNWKKEYYDYMENFTKDPPVLPIDDSRVFKPVFNEQNDPNDVKLYSKALNKYIISFIGEQPQYIEKYQIILITGLKINIDEYIYNKVNNYLEKYIEKEM